MLTNRRLLACVRTFVVAAGVVGLAGACADSSPAVDAGRRDIQEYGCGACHRIGGVPAADGNVGPPLDGLADRKVIGGRLLNTPDNLARWIRFPQSVDPGVDMPDLGLTAAEARAIAAYLLRGPHAG